MIQETSHQKLNRAQGSLFGFMNDEASSARVKPGCTLNLFENHNNQKFMESLTADASSLKKNDKASSVSCTCQGMITTPTHLELYPKLEVPPS